MMHRGDRWSPEWGTHRGMPRQFSDGDNQTETPFALTAPTPSDKKFSSFSYRARSEKDITRVSGTLSPSSILGGRTIVDFLLSFQPRVANWVAH